MQFCHICCNSFVFVSISAMKFIVLQNLTWLWWKVLLKCVDNLRKSCLHCPRWLKYLKHPCISHILNLETQILENKNNRVWGSSRVVLLETKKDKQWRFRNANIEVVPILKSHLSSLKKAEFHLLYLLFRLNLQHLWLNCRIPGPAICISMSKNTHMWNTSLTQNGLDPIFQDNHFETRH